MENGKDKATILVVDDQPENIDVLSNLLRDEFRVKAATSGEKALKIAGQKEKPALILMDIMMPGLDGFEVCKKLKENGTTSDIPVIFISALDGAECRDKALFMGAVECLNKPIDPEMVLKCVRIQIKREIK